MASSLARVRRGVQITGILLEHNLLGQLRELARSARNGGVTIPEGMPKNVRVMMEEMGPTYIKMGQLLASRPDLVPKQFADEFGNMYDRTTPSPFPEVKALIEAELGKRLEELFSEFDPNPIASASIGQVHAARLRTGEKVAVKVQHPGIEENVRLDFAILKPLVRFTENLFASTRLFQPSGHLIEIQQMLERELDYRYEARNHQKFYEMFKDDGEVRVPRIYWEYSTRRVLVFEFVEGIHPSEVDHRALKEMGIDGTELSKIITRAMARMIFQERVFHADPSPGNLIIMGPGRVAFLDFGAVGHVSKRRAERVIQLISGFVREELDDIAQALLELCEIRGDVDVAGLKRDVERVLDYHEREGASIGDPQFMDLIGRVAIRNNMLLPADFFLISRALFQMEGLCSRLDPNYLVVESLLPHVMRYSHRDIFSPRVRDEMLRDAALTYLEFIRTFPHRFNNLVRKIEQDRLVVRAEIPGVKELQAGNERRLVRMSASVLLGAILVAVSVASLSASPNAIVNMTFFGGIFALVWAFAMLFFAEGKE